MNSKVPIWNVIVNAKACVLEKDLCLSFSLNKIANGYVLRRTCLFLNIPHLLRCQALKIMDLKEIKQPLLYTRPFEFACRGIHLHASWSYSQACDFTALARKYFLHEIHTDKGGIRQLKLVDYRLAQADHIPQYKTKKNRDEICRDTWVIPFCSDLFTFALSDTPNNFIAYLVIISQACDYDNHIYTNNSFIYRNIKNNNMYSWHTEI